MSDLITVNDPVSGMPNYSYRSAPLPGDSDYEFTAYLLDFDQRGEHPWANYEITRQGFGFGSIVLESVRISWDDGTSVFQEVDYFGALGNFPIRWSETYTRRDAQDRITSVTEFFDSVITPVGRSSAIRYSQTEFVAGTDRVDYSYVVFATGRIEAKDFNADTGLIDYAYTVFADGRTLAEDFDATGRLDYAIERWPDGRSVVTDYDLLDAHPWTSYAIAYAASGAIESVTVL